MALQNAIHGRVDTWNKKESLKEGDKLTGFYARSEKFVSKLFGEGEKFIICDENGEDKAGLMSQAMIKQAFMNIPLGCYVEIVYTGKTQSSRGQMVNQYDIQFDPDRKVVINN